MKLKIKINQENDIKKKIVRIMETKFSRWKKLKMDEIEKIFQFYKSFKIKQMVINRKRTKFKRKPNWRVSLKNWMIWRGIEGERKKREGKKGCRCQTSDMLTTPVA